MTAASPRKPLIGLSGRRGTGAMMGAVAAFSDSPLDVYMSEYATAVQKAGGIPIHIPLDSDAADIVDRLDALLLSGGDDIDPGLYGAERAAETDRGDLHRDSFELALIDAALDRGIPILGICRGHQLINVARGGTLVQHLETHEQHAAFDSSRDTPVHGVTVVDGSLASELYGSEVEVNSFHHQAVDRLGRDVIVTARSHDGAVEALELRDLPVVGVQWHPEAFGEDPIFGWLVESAIWASTSAPADEITARRAAA